MICLALFLGALAITGLVHDLVSRITEVTP